MSVLTQRVIELVGRKFPGLELPRTIAFAPMLDINSGELSTTVAVEIARMTRQRAEVIADGLIVDLATEVSATWRHDNGYIVCSGLSRDALLAEVYSSVSEAMLALDSGLSEPDGFARSICCLLPDCVEPAYVRIRLLARALLQALLTVVYQGRVRLRVSPWPERVVCSAEEVVVFFADLVRLIVTNEVGVQREANNFNGGAWSAVWTTHHHHEHLSSTDRKALALMREAGATRITMPADGWLLSRDRAMSEILSAQSFSRIIQVIRGTDGWFRFLLHAASTTPSGDFDPAVALFDESASPLWNMRALVERYGRFGRLLPLPVTRSKICEFLQGVEERRSLVVTSLFLPLYAAHAILHNRVDAWCEAFERVGREGHAFVNAPATRLALEDGMKDETCGEIAASLGFGLSCILPVIKGTG